MLISELISLLEEKKNKHWDIEVKARKNLWHWDFAITEITNVTHYWEEWCHIILKNYI